MWGRASRPSAESPLAELTLDKSGSLYGTANGGAYNYGLVFQLSPSSTLGFQWTRSVLYNFKAGNYDGSYPAGALVFDHSGNLFGATEAGGTTGPPCGLGCGTVFKLAPPAVPGGAWTETLLHKFGSGTDGTSPNGGVLMDSAGALYGTPYGGGNNAVCASHFPNGCGIVYKLARPKLTGGAWSEKIIYSFGGSSDGLVPNSGLLLDRSGAMYGTTEWGGYTTGATAAAQYFNSCPEGVLCGEWLIFWCYLSGPFMRGWSPTFAPQRQETITATALGRVPHFSRTLARSGDSDFLPQLRPVTSNLDHEIQTADHRQGKRWRARSAVQSPRQKFWGL